MAEGGSSELTDPHLQDTGRGANRGVPRHRLRFEHPFSGKTGSGPALRLRAGGTHNQIEVEDADGDSVADSGHGLGREAGAGVTFAIGESLRSRPGCATGCCRGT